MLDFGGGFCGGIGGGVVVVVVVGGVPSNVSPILSLHQMVKMWASNRSFKQPFLPRYNV